MSEWHPMETAPTDGTHILAAVEVHSNITDTCWWEIHIIGVDDETGDVDSDLYQGWNWGDYTHWMPLPQPPPPVGG
jgi:hypothetical protein